jgi:hypothetical protein
MLAQTVKDTVKVMLANGKMPPPPSDLADPWTPNIWG